MSYNGAISQIEQETRLQAFTEGRISILVCTASLQAGIDVDVKTVISVGMRENVEETVQEAGRAGRREQSGYTTFSSSKTSQKENFHTWRVLG